MVLMAEQYITNEEVLSSGILISDGYLSAQRDRLHTMLRDNCDIPGEGEPDGEPEPGVRIFLRSRISENVKFYLKIRAILIFIRVNY